MHRYVQNNNISNDALPHTTQVCWMPMQNPQWPPMEVVSVMLSTVSSYLGRAFDAYNDASNLEQVANLLYTQANSAASSQHDRK